MPVKIASKYAPQDYGQSNQFQYQDPQRAQFNPNLSAARSTATDNRSSFYDISRVDPNMIITSGQRGTYDPSKYKDYSFNPTNTSSNPNSARESTQIMSQGMNNNLNQGLANQKYELDTGYSRYDPNITLDKYNNDLQNKKLNFMTNNNQNLIGDNMSLSQEEIDRFRNPVTSLGDEASGYTKDNKDKYDKIQSSFESGLPMFSKQNTTNVTDAINNNVQRTNATTDYNASVSQANNWRAKADQMYQNGHWDEYVGGLPDSYGKVGANFREVADAKISNAQNLYNTSINKANTAENIRDDYQRSNSVYDPASGSLNANYSATNFMTENPYATYKSRIDENSLKNNRKLYKEDENVRIQ